MNKMQNIKNRKTSSLAKSNPKLALEWHPTINRNMTPNDVAPNSHKKVWWKCSKNHEWQASIANRNKGKGCPYCSGRFASKDNCLEKVDTKLASEWHPIKNRDLTPRNVKPHSHNKVWWKCNNGHEWQASIDKRSNGRNCPYCSGSRLTSDNCLQKINPNLAKEWHPTLNGNLTPSEVFPNSGKKVWWKCEKSHEWQSTIDKRSNGRKCPYCSNKAVNKENCLQTNYPQIGKEWCWSKNGTLSPKDFTPFSSKKVWWVCKFGHKWEAVISSRSSGCGCPTCNMQTSLLELRIFTELKYIFGKVKHRHRINGKECDIYLPSQKFGIEVDGWYWHKEKLEFDKNKSKVFNDNGIFLLRLRGKGLKKLSKDDIIFSKNTKHFDLLKKILKIMMANVRISEKIEEKIHEYLKNQVLINKTEYNELVKNLPSPIPGYSLADRNTKISKEWHKEKNKPLTPNDFAPFSHKKI